MTLPRERQLAIKNTRIFLLDLMDPKKTPRVPHAIRKEASHCLKHYPTEYDMGEAAESLERQNEVHPARPRSFTYSTNMMGPWSLDWYRDRNLLKNVWITVETEEVANRRRMDIGEKYLIEEVTEQYAGGRIDIRGDTESPYGDEYSVPPMLMEDWNAFGDWLWDLETTEQWDYDILISIFEGEVLNGRKIRWADK